VYYDLFEKIKRGSIMLWNVEDEKDLPKRKEMIRLLGTENFTYYKSHGHHRDYIRILAKLSLYLSSNALEKEAGYWAQMEMSHFLFTDKEIESNSFFLLKYANKCYGTYYVEASDIKQLEDLTRAYEQVRSITDEVRNWGSRIQKHKDEITRDGINDQFISRFEIANLQTLMRGYGAQAIDHARSLLENWHDQHYWKSKKAKAQVEARPKNEDLVESST
jgi:hypothetical protein